MVIQLRDGPIVREDAVRLALKLEEACHVLSAANGVLTVTNGSALSDEDRQAIGACKAHLLALVGYCKEGHEAR